MRDWLMKKRLHDPQQTMKREQLIGLSFVVALHGAGLYALWSYRILPTPVEAFVMVSNLIDPPPQPPKPPQPKPPKPQPIEPPQPQQLVAEAPVLLPDEPVAPPPPPEPVIEAPPQPVVLASELSVNCPERSPPDYPALSMRMNEQGKVVLRVELGEDGRVAEAEVKTSSGHRRLDDAALNTVRTWHCKPLVRNGAAVRAVALQPFDFILEGR
jgi:protein TonB